MSPKNFRARNPVGQTARPRAAVVRGPRQLASEPASAQNLNSRIRCSESETLGRPQPAVVRADANSSGRHREVQGNGESRAGRQQVKLVMRSGVVTQTVADERR